LSSDSATIPFVRHQVVDHLRARGWSTDRVDEAALLTTELTTNAVEHAPGEYRVVLDLTDQRLRIEVEDSSITAPVLQRAPSADNLHGRGMLFLEVIASQWGVAARAAGKSVWFELAREVT
jgi:anti-sigma regulatory factor (Ser/Thr protein kinase)